MKTFPIINTPDVIGIALNLFREGVAYKKTKQAEDIRRREIALEASLERQRMAMWAGKEILCTAIDWVNGVRDRGTMELQMEMETGTHEAFMEKIETLLTYGDRFYPDMTDEEKRAYHRAMQRLFGVERQCII